MQRVQSDYARQFEPDARLIVAGNQVMRRFKPF